MDIWSLLPHVSDGISKMKAPAVCQNRDLSIVWDKVSIPHKSVNRPFKSLRLSFHNNDQRSFPWNLLQVRGQASLRRRGDLTPKSHSTRCAHCWLFQMWVFGMEWLAGMFRQTPSRCQKRNRGPMEDRVRTENLEYQVDPLLARGEAAHDGGKFTFREFSRWFQVGGRLLSGFDCGLVCWR
jgi:hypothetical protein